MVEGYLGSVEALESNTLAAVVAHVANALTALTGGAVADDAAADVGGDAMAVEYVALEGENM